MSTRLESLLPADAPPWKRAMARSLDPSVRALHPFARLQSWLTVLRTTVELRAAPVPLGTLQGWDRDPERIRHPQGAFFEVIGVEASIGNREIASWCQPLMRQVTPGLVAFLVKPIDGVWHLLAQAKMEPGCAEILEIGPTVQITTPFPGEDPATIPFAADVLRARGLLHYDVVQSEEGGRFFHEGNRHVLMEMAPDFAAEPPAFYHWMTFAQLHRFITTGHCVNIEARSLMACVSPY